MCLMAVLQWGLVYGILVTVAKMAKRSSKTFLRCAQKIEDGAIALARRKGCTAVCCGHTHVAAAKTEQPIAYYNGGCWTELPCNYLTVVDGVVTLHAYAEEKAEAPGLAVAATG